jgi:hypothetical protein
MVDSFDRIAKCLRSEIVHEQLQGCSLLSKQLDDECAAFDFADNLGLLQRLVHLAAHSTSNIQTRVGVMLQKLTKLESIATRLVESCSVLDVMARFLEQDSPILSAPNNAGSSGIPASSACDLRSYGCAIITNISFYPSLADKIISHNSNLIPSLLDAVGNGDRKTKAFACDAIYNLCYSPASCASLAPHRSTLVHQLSSMLGNTQDPRAELCAALSIINMLEREAQIPEKCVEAFSPRCVGAMVGALDASLHHREFLGKIWRPFVFAMNRLSFIHKCRPMLERYEVVQLLLQVVRNVLSRGPNDTELCTAALLATETILNILTGIPRHLWKHVMGDEGMAEAYQLFIGTKIVLLGESGKGEVLVDGIRSNESIRIANVKEADSNDKRCRYFAGATSVDWSTDSRMDALNMLIDVFSHPSTASSSSAQVDSSSSSHATPPPTPQLQSTERPTFLWPSQAANSKTCVASNVNPPQNDFASNDYQTTVSTSTSMPTTAAVLAAFSASSFASNELSLYSSTRTFDVLGEIIHDEDSQLSRSFQPSYLSQSAPILPAAVEGPKLRPGQKRCPTCVKACPVRASKCPGCGYCFYLTVSPHTPSQQVGKGQKMCPSCGLLCAAKRSRCPGCDYAYFAMKRPLIDGFAANMSTTVARTDRADVTAEVDIDVLSGTSTTSFTVQAEEETETS